MFVDRKPFLYLWRPVYKYLVLGVLWPVLGRIGRHVFAEATQRLDELSRRTLAVEAQLAALRQHIDSRAAEADKRFNAVNGQLQALVCRMDVADAEMMRRWNAIESLLLSVLSERAGCMQQQDFR